MQRVLGLLPAVLVGVTGAQAQSVWVSGGPTEGGEVVAMTRAPSNRLVLFAADPTAVYRSADGGSTWERRSGLAAATLAVSPDGVDIVFAGTEGGGIKKSTDGGANWTHLGLDNAYVNTIAIHPTNGSILYAGTGEPMRSYSSEVVGVFKSSDGGETWDPTSAASLDAVMAILIDANNPNHIYAGVDGTNTKIFRKSTDAGATWQDHFTSSSGYVTALAMTPAGHAPAAVYAIAWGDDVFKSLDGGETWTSTSSPWISTGSPWALAVDPSSPDRVFASSKYASGSVFRTDNAGASWAITATGLATGGAGVASSILIDPSTSEVLVGCPQGGGIFRSTNGGDSWAPATDGLARADIRYLAAHPATPDQVFAVSPGNEKRMWATFDGGGSWDVLAQSPLDLGAVAIDPQAPGTVWVGDGYKSANTFHVYRSADSGDSWTPVPFATYSPEQNIMEVSDIVVHPQNADQMLVAAQFLVNNGTITGQGILARTLDGGASWSPLGFSTTSLAVDPSDVGTVVAGKESSGQVYRYENVWGSWGASEITPNGGIGAVRDIAIDDQGRIYVAASDGLWKREGGTWTTLSGLPTSDITAITVDGEHSPTKVYAGTASEGVYVSTDAGASWTDFNDGLANPGIAALVVAGNVLYAGTHYGGVWKRSLGSSQPVQLDAAVLLEGAYVSGGVMAAGLTDPVSSVIPLLQPYAQEPFNYTGSEEVADGFFVAHDDVVDWVLVELATGNPSESLTTSAGRAGLLLTDGSIVDLDGASPLAFSDAELGAYYVIVTHRNHLPVMSATPVDLTDGNGTVDFTTSTSASYGSQAVSDLGDGSFGLFAGDADANGQVQNTDMNLIWAPDVGKAGYHPADFDLNGQVQNTDKNLLWAPNVGRGTQVP